MSFGQGTFIQALKTCQRLRTSLIAIESSAAPESDALSKVLVFVGTQLHDFAACLSMAFDMCAPPSVSDLSGVIDSISTKLNELIASETTESEMQESRITHFAANAETVLSLSDGIRNGDVRLDR